MHNFKKNGQCILLSNDDGIDSPGLHAAVEALLPVADLIIAAPRHQHSGAGRSQKANPHAVFERKVLSIAGTTVHGWALDASPAAATRHALHCLAGKKKPDLIVSGINLGENIGSNSSASGTVGAAVEAAVNGCRAIAVSRVVPSECHYDHSRCTMDWSGTIDILRKAVHTFTNALWPSDVDIIKIDIPENADADTPWQVCRQSREPGWWDYIPGGNDASPVHATMARRGPRIGAEWEPNSDGWALWTKNEVAITPLSVDMSSRTVLESIQEMIKG